MSLQEPPMAGGRRRKGLGVEMPLNAAADSIRPKTTASRQVEPNPDHKLERRGDRKRSPNLDPAKERRLPTPADHPADATLDRPGTLRRAAGAFKRVVSGERSRRANTPVNGLSLHDDRVTGAYRERELIAHEHHMSARRPQPPTDIDSTDAREAEHGSISSGTPLETGDSTEPPRGAASPRRDDEVSPSDA